jgi:hypothetical protein
VVSCQVVGNAEPHRFIHKNAGGYLTIKEFLFRDYTQLPLPLL